MGFQSNDASRGRGVLTMILTPSQKKHIGQRLGEYRKITGCVGLRPFGNTGKNKSYYKWECLNCGSTGEDIYANIKARIGKCKNCSDKGGSGARKDWVGKRHYNRVVTGVAEWGSKENKNSQYAWLCDGGHTGTARIESLKKNGCGQCVKEGKSYTYPSDAVGKKLGRRTITKVEMIKGVRVYHLICKYGHETKGHNYNTIKQTRCEACYQFSKPVSDEGFIKSDEEVIVNGRGIISPDVDKTIMHMCLHCGKVSETTRQSYMNYSCRCGLHEAHCDDDVHIGLGSHCIAPKKIIELLTDLTVFGVTMEPGEIEEVFGISADELANAVITRYYEGRYNKKRRLLNVEDYIKRQLTK